ncbi:MAG: class I SAM-dependent RNA methyltransferase, partial [Bacteroidia bacterium]|nr:class I SAM-dependent RNA methyltransferase [Bacteroidia bacterium]
MKKNSGIFSMTAKTSFGFEDLLAEELRQAGARAIRKGVRAVFYEGDMETMYRANLFS